MNQDLFDFTLEPEDMNHDSWFGGISSNLAPSLSECVELNDNTTRIGSGTINNNVEAQNCRMALENNMNEPNIFSELYGIRSPSNPFFFQSSDPELQFDDGLFNVNITEEALNFNDIPITLDDLPTNNINNLVDDINGNGFNLVQFCGLDMGTSNAMDDVLKETGKIVDELFKGILPTSPPDCKRVQKRKRKENNNVKTSNNQQQRKISIEKILAEHNYTFNKNKNNKAKVDKNNKKDIIAIELEKKGKKEDQEKARIELREIVQRLTKKQKNKQLPQAQLSIVSKTNKNDTKLTESDNLVKPVVRRPRGRPPGSKNKKKPAAETCPLPSVSQPSTSGTRSQLNKKPTTQKKCQNTKSVRKPRAKAMTPAEMEKKREIKRLKHNKAEKKRRRQTRRKLLKLERMMFGTNKMKLPFKIVLDTQVNFIIFNRKLFEWLKARQIVRQRRLCKVTIRKRRN